MLSLLAEEERIRALMIEAKAGGDEQAPPSADAKAEPAESKGEEKAKVSEVKKVTKIAPATTVAPLPDNLADIKPLKLRSDLKPLPSIKATPAGQPRELAVDLQEKKKMTEQVVKKGQEQLQGQRRNEEDLKSKLDPSEIERRERHMKEQRDLLIAKKKAERERKVQAEEERKRKMAAGEDLDEKQGSSSPGRFSSMMTDTKQGDDDDNDDVAEMRRATMRMALARRLKMDLMENEEAKRNEVQETQFAELDKKLQQVEQLREDNRKREYILNKQLERQQEQIARNIELSAAAMSRTRDD